MSRMCTIDSNSSVCCHLHGNVGALVLRRGACANRFYGCVGDQPFAPTQLATLAWRAVARGIYLSMTCPCGPLAVARYFILVTLVDTLSHRVMRKKFQSYVLTARQLLPF